VCVCVCVCVPFNVKKWKSNPLLPSNGSWCEYGFHHGDGEWGAEGCCSIELH